MPEGGAQRRAKKASEASVVLRRDIGLALEHASPSMGYVANLLLLDRYLRVGLWVRLILEMLGRYTA
jgi:hypothetical protein